MKRPFIIAAGAVALTSAGIISTAAFAPFAAQPAKAAPARAQTATFAIENMTCATCPITVKKAIAGVTGVQAVNVDFDAKTATVRFDASKTTIAAIARASTNAGYPARATKI
ncbi:MULTISPECIES: heavy-metal-associated domain-containing protein [Sphingomonadales]|jgi:periplasmic mercuric ion binding protein|uniref:Heavy metal transporter n=1 Tax=Sphingopyxis macrogoltabida TaxID=33050 RepID=A0AAC9AVL3_SPHMC|nr:MULTISPECIES: cation transporter [Sphingomonadaceae]OAP33834.1 heavy metal transporter [Sphingobium sp. 20006FA]OJY70740.1 MAG: heavy metal transporter [Sphingobium sp. 66-54]ALJ12440.1 heavy metal transporter [Sphingopyxis macrogoltabida]AMU90080.1 heavy metal transporter [Sphingopyxis macrogoltabida]KXU31222.1 heavy metal transporter [Sphingobium sp. AM]